MSGTDHTRTAELEADFDAGVAERMMRFELDLAGLAEVQEVHLQTRVELVAESAEAVIDRCNLELEDKPVLQVQGEVAAEPVAGSVTEQLRCSCHLSLLPCRKCLCTRDNHHISSYT